MKRTSHNDNETSSLSQPIIKKRTSILPSANEQLLLQQTSLLTRENLSQLQISGLLSEVSCQSLYQNKVLLQWIDQFSQTLKDHMSQSMIKVSATNNNKWNSLVGLDAIIINNLIESNGKSMQVPAPIKIKVIGSHDLQCGTSPYINVDICLTIPDNFFDRRYIL